MMLNTLHYDVAFYVPGNKWHPGISKNDFVFTALTPRGREQLETAPWGELYEGLLIVSEETKAAEVMDHIEALEVYMSQ